MADPRRAITRFYRGLDGFEIPSAEEKAVRASRGSPTYGEITPTGVARMLDYLAMDEGDVFYDLGAGSGKVVIQTAMTASVRKCIGVELAPSRVRIAKKILRAVRREDLLVASACAFRCEDLLETYLADATVLYTCSTAFSSAFLARIVARVARLSRPVRFLTLQDLARPPRGFERVTSLRVPSTWTRTNEVAVYHVSPSA